MTMNNCISHAIKHANISRYDVLAFAYDASLEQNFKEMKRFLGLAANMDDGLDVSFSIVRSAVQDACLNNYKICIQRKSVVGTEFSLVHSWFRMNAKIHGLDIVKGFSLERGLKPDFYVLNDGVPIPVECKKTFTDRSLSQLLEYMNEMGVSKGVAVALKFNIENLPKSIMRIDVPSDWQNHIDE